MKENICLSAINNQTVGPIRTKFGGDLEYPDTGVGGCPGLQPEFHFVPSMTNVDVLILLKAFMRLSMVQRT